VKLALVAVCLLALALAHQPIIDLVLQREQQHLASLEAQAGEMHDAAGQAGDAGEIARQRGLVALIAARGDWFLAAVGALVVFGALYDVAMQFLTAYFKQRAWNLITIVVTLLQPALIITLLLPGWGLSGVLLGLCLTPVVALLLATQQARRAATAVPPATAAVAGDPALLPRFARFAGMSWLVQLSGWFYDVQFLTFVLFGLGMRLEQVAVLAFAYKFAKDYLGYAYMPFSGVVTPLLARIRGRDDPAALHEAAAALTRLFGLMLLPAGMALAALTPRLLALLYPAYTETVTLIAILIAGTFLESLLSVPHNVLMVYERYRPVLVARALALVSVPLLVVLVPGFGLVGAALAVAVARVVSRLATVVALRRVLGVTLPWRALARNAAASLAMVVPLALLAQVWPLPASAAGLDGKLLAAASLAVLGVLALAGYLLALRWSGGIDPADRARLLGLRVPFRAWLARVL
jgi:O-antigen/teichoic acid export membrane protein